MRKILALLGGRDQRAKAIDLKAKAIDQSAKANKRFYPKVNQSNLK